MTDRVFLVTGAMGCIGSWVLRHLVEEGLTTVATDSVADMMRPRLLLGADHLDRLAFSRADITDAAELMGVISEHNPTHLIHLAGLMVPYCKQTPAMGARVNIEGTINVLEAARFPGSRVKSTVYASSVAVFGPDEDGAGLVVDTARQRPLTLYGAFKQADEVIASIYWQDWRVASVGLRPYVVDGVGRDRGVTADLTKALLAAAAGMPYKIRFGGTVALQYASDVAQTFIACAKKEAEGALVCNLRNDVVEVDDFIAAIHGEVPHAKITYDKESPLPFPAELDDTGLRSLLGRVPHTPLLMGVRETIGSFESLLAKGLIDLHQLDE